MPTAYEVGDANCDGKLSAADITRIARHLAEISVEEDPYIISLFDTDKSGAVNAADATHLARYLARIIDKL